jgi:ribose 5-phosphate isomerase A
MAASTKLTAIEQSKRLAAYTAVDKHILPEHKVGHLSLPLYHVLKFIIMYLKVIGIGSG